MTLSSNFTDLITIGGISAATATGFVLKNGSNQLIQFGVAGSAGNFQNSSLQGDGVIAATRGIIITGSYWSLLAPPTLTEVLSTAFNGNGVTATVTVTGGTTTFPVNRFIILRGFSEAGINGPQQVTGGSPTTITFASIYITSFISGVVSISDYTPTNMSGNITHTGSLVLESNIDEGDVEIVTPSISVTSLVTSKLVISDVVGRLTSVAGGTSNQTLVIVGGIPTWQALSLTSSVSGILPVANGGTNLNSVGLEGQVLTTFLGVTAWITPTTGTVTSVTASSPLASSGGATPNISITSSIGTGAVVLQTSPTLITPNIGIALAQSLTMSLSSPFLISSSDTGITSRGIILSAFRSSLVLNGAGQPGGFQLSCETASTFCLMQGAVTLNGSITLSISGGGGGNLTVPGTTTLNGPTTLNALTASSALATDASKNLISITHTGTGSNVLANTPTLITPILGVATGTSLILTGATLETSILKFSDIFSNGAIDAVTGAVLIGYNMAKTVGVRDTLQVFDNSTNRNVLLKVTSAGTGSGTNSTTINTTTTLGGNVGIRVFTTSGTLSAIGNFHQTALPSGVTASNVISMSGVVQTAYLMTAFDTRNPTFYWSFYLNNVGSIDVITGGAATDIAGSGYRLTFITNS